MVHKMVAAAAAFIVLVGIVAAVWARSILATARSAARLPHKCRARSANRSRSAGSERPCSRGSRSISSR